jgi:hypothetical protein
MYLQRKSRRFGRWDPLGKHVWCCYRNEAWRVRIEDAEIERFVFPHNCSHVHASLDGTLIVCDDFIEFFRGAPTRVHFLNRRTGRELTLVDNPKYDNHTGRLYHIDPHPRFCCDDRYVAFTTTVLGAVDLAVVETEALLQATT